MTKNSNYTITSREIDQHECQFKYLSCVILDIINICIHIALAKNIQ